jgi:hypothetical protein
VGRPKTIRVTSPRTPAGATDPRYDGAAAFYLVYTNKRGEVVREVRTFKRSESPKTYIEGQGLDFTKAVVRPVR